MATTSSERGLSLRSPGRFMATAARLIELYKKTRPDGDASARRDVVRAWMDAETYRLYTFQIATRLMAGEPIGSGSSLNKIFWSEMDLRMHETALDLLGAKGELEPEASAVVDEGRWMRGYQFALAGPIYAGTNEIQRNIIAQRVLGLPRK